MKPITTRDKSFYRDTHTLANTSECRYRMGAIIVQGNRIVSMGVNRLKTHPSLRKYREHCISIHAELDAILRARAAIVGATMYIARNGGIVSKPCPTCHEIIRTSGIKYIVYSTERGLRKERI